jgi:hypothetical protein
MRDCPVAGALDRPCQRALDARHINKGKGIEASPLRYRELTPLRFAKIHNIGDVIFVQLRSGRYLRAEESKPERRIPCGPGARKLRETRPYYTRKAIKIKPVGRGHLPLSGSRRRRMRFMVPEGPVSWVSHYPALSLPATAIVCFVSLLRAPRTFFRANSSGTAPTTIIIHRSPIRTLKPDDGRAGLQIYQDFEEGGSCEAAAGGAGRLFSSPLCSRCSIAFSNSFW